MLEILLVVYLLVAVGLIGLVLVQHGKGADMGASMGAGASNSVFGSSGSGNFLTRSTAILATVFFIISLVLGNISTHREGFVPTEIPNETIESAIPSAPVDNNQTTAIPAAPASETVEAAASDVPPAPAE